MLELIKEAAAILKDLPELAIWILVGILFYKVFIIGGTIGLIKFAITKLHNYMVNPKVVTKEVSIDGHFICTDSSFAAFLSVISIVANRSNNRNTYNSGKLWSSDVQWLREAVEEKIKKDKDALKAAKK